MLDRSQRYRQPASRISSRTSILLNCTPASVTHVNVARHRTCALAAGQALARRRFCGASLAAQFRAKYCFASVHVCAVTLRVDERIWLAPAEQLVAFIFQVKERAVRSKKNITRQ